MSVTTEGADCLLDRLGVDKKSLVVGMEATGHYWLPAYEYLSERGLDVRVIALLDQVFPEYASLFSDTFGTTSKELLLQCSTLEDMLAVSTRKLNKASHGRFGEKKAKELRGVAADSFGVGFAGKAFAFQIRQLIEQLMFLENQIKDLEEQLSHLLRKTNEVITTIPGIGDTLGAIILNEIGDIHRFDAPGNLVAFAGLDVKVNQSGEFSGTRQMISKRGSPYLRRAIWLIAQRVVFCVRPYHQK